MFWQIKAATRMTNWDAQTIIPSFDFLYCHCYQLDIWMENQLRNFDPFKNRKTNSVIRRSLEENRTAASPCAALWGEGRGQDWALDQAGSSTGRPWSTDVPAPFWAWKDRGKSLFFSVSHRAHPPSWLACHCAHFKKLFGTDVGQAGMEMVEWPAVPNRRGGPPNQIPLHRLVFLHALFCS